MSAANLLLAEFGPVLALERARLPALLERLRDARPQAASSRERRTLPSATKGNVAIVPVRGLIAPRSSWVLDFLGGTPLDWLVGTVQTLVADPNVREIVMDVDSPGGSAAGVQEASAAIFAMRGKKPIRAVANTLAASAAYWLASSADEVIASPSSELGSIGVYAAHLDFSKANERAGVAVSYVVSQGSPRKIDGNPDQPLTEQARADVQERVDEIYMRFTRDVSRNRGVSYAAIRAAADGRTYSAAKAVKLGLADRVGTLQETLMRSMGRGTPEGRAEIARLQNKYAPFPRRLCS